MLRSSNILLIFFLSILFILLSCAKEDVIETPVGRMPITTNSSEAAAAYQEGLAYANNLQIVAAAEFFRKAVDLDPSFAMAWLNLAYSSPGTTRFMAALDSAKVHANHVSDAERLIISAAEYGVQGNNVKQLATLNQLVANYPADEIAHQLLGNYHFGVQDFRQAIKSYNEATIINENLVIAYNQLGYSQRALGNYGEAEKAFKFSIRLNPDNPNAYDSYAELLMEMGRYTESIEFYQKALSKDKTFVASHIGIATNYGFLGEFSNGHQQLQILMDTAQNFIQIRQAIFSKAVLYVTEGKLDKATDHLLKSFNIAKTQNDIANMANDLVQVGNLYLEQGKLDEALTTYHRSIRIINESSLQQLIIENAQSTHLFNIARVYARQGDFDRAKQTADIFYQKVSSRKNPVQQRLSFQLNGIIALQEQDYKTAIKEFEQANQLNPRNLYRIGLAYEGLGNSDEAYVFFQRAQELNVLNSMDQAFVLSTAKSAKVS